MLNPIKPSKPCPKKGCPYHVILQCCRGVSDPEHKGFWYESCNAPGGPAGSQSHFVRWAKEIPRAGAELLTSQLPRTLQGLPLTPQKLPPRSPLPKRIMTPSPSDTAITTQDPGSSAVLSNLANCDSMPSPSPELAAPDALSLPLELLDSVTNIESEENIPQEPSASTDPNWDNDRITHTRIHVKKGVAITSCNGPICRAFPSKEPVRNCSTCTFEFCKKCCVAYQKTTGKLCSKHLQSVPYSLTAPLSESSAATVGISVSTAAGPDESNLNRPLRAEHYDARDQAQKAWEVRKNQLTQQKIATDALKQTITIMYWKANDSEVDVFTVPCPRFPVFDLNSCVSTVRAEMGISDDDKLIETFDLTQGRWVSHSPSTPRDVGTQPTLLYHTRGVKAGIDMEDEVAKLVKHGKARKRPVELILTTPHIDQRVRPRIVSPLVIVPTEAPQQKELEVIELDDSDDDPPSPTTISMVPIKKEKSASPAPLNRAPLVPRSLFVPSVNNKKSRSLHLAKSIPYVDFTAGSDSEVDEDVLGVRASSGHAAWPLKYVKSMAEGFRLMDTMEGELRSRFNAAFGMNFPGSKATFHTHANIWEATTEKQRDQYIKAGFTNEGLWKKFRHDVQNMYGGKIPGKRDRKGETCRKVSIKGRKTVQVKVEPQELEHQHDVIVLDD